MKVVLKKGSWVLKTKNIKNYCVVCKIKIEQFYFCAERKKTYCRSCLKEYKTSRNTHSDYFITEVEVE